MFGPYLEGYWEKGLRRRRDAIRLVIYEDRSTCWVEDTLVGVHSGPKETRPQMSSSRLEQERLMASNQWSGQDGERSNDYLGT